MTDDDAWALVRRLARMVFLDGVRPSRTLGWVGTLAPVVTQATVGAGHWASGRRRRALAAWASAAGFGLAAWGLGTEAPGRAEWDNSLRELGVRAPATGEADAPAGRRRSPNGWQDVAPPVAWMVIGVPWGLGHPRRLTVLAIAMEAPNVAFYAARAAWSVQRRRPRIAAGSALAAAGSVARLRAAAAEPLR